MDPVLGSVVVDMLGDMVMIIGLLGNNISITMDVIGTGLQEAIKLIVLQLIAISELQVERVTWLALNTVMVERDIVEVDILALRLRAEMRMGIVLITP